LLPDFVEVRPKNSRVLNNLATVYDSMKEYANAERVYKKAVKLDTHSAMIYKNWEQPAGAAQVQEGLESYKVALEIDPHIFENGSSPRVQNPASVTERGAMNFYMAKAVCERNEGVRYRYLRMALNEALPILKDRGRQRVRQPARRSRFRAATGFAEATVNQQRNSTPPNPGQRFK